MTDTQRVVCSTVLVVGACVYSIVFGQVPPRPAPATPYGESLQPQPLWRIPTAAVG